ncbi:MAG: ComF family protein, partial [Terriglobales bacterium]
MAAVPGLDAPGCRQCGKSWPEAEASADGRCLNCQTDPPAYLAALSAAAYREQARQLLHLLKFEGVATAAGYWAERLARLAGQLPETAEVIVPVPLGRRRQRERGYNQSAEIARRLARHLGCRYAPRGLRRVRETAPQAGLTLQERERNIARAFAGESRHVAGRCVLLIDDVLTTGATARAAAAALCRAGARQVLLLTAARADLLGALAAAEDTSARVALAPRDKDDGGEAGRPRS